LLRRRQQQDGAEKAADERNDRQHPAVDARIFQRCFQAAAVGEGRGDLRGEERDGRGRVGVDGRQARRDQGRKRQERAAARQGVMNPAANRREG